MGPPNSRYIFFERLTTSLSRGGGVKRGPAEVEAALPRDIRRAAASRLARSHGSVGGSVERALLGLALGAVRRRCCRCCRRCSSSTRTSGSRRCSRCAGPVERCRTTSRSSASRATRRPPSGQTSELDEWPRTLHAELDRSPGGGRCRGHRVRRVVRGAARLRTATTRLAPRFASRQRAAARAGRERDDPGRSGRPGASGSGAFCRLPELKAAALGSAPFVLPRGADSGRSVLDVRPRGHGLAVAAGGGVAGVPAAALRGRCWRCSSAPSPGFRASWPPTRAAVVAAGDLETLVQTVRGAFQREPGAGGRRSRRARSRAADRGEPAALRALLDLYAGAGSRYLELLRPAAHDPHDPVRQACARRRRARSRRQRWCSSASPSASAGAAGRLLLGVLAAHRHQLERRRDRGDGVRESARAAHASAAADAAAPAVGARSRASLLGTAFGPLSTRRALSSPRVAGGVSSASPTGGSSGARCGGRSSCRCSCRCPRRSRRPCWNYPRSALQRQRVHVALGHYVPAPGSRRLAEQSTAHGARTAVAARHVPVHGCGAYTSVAESLGPSAGRADERLLRVLFQVVEQHGGRVSDTAGDSMVAVWAAARPDPAMRLAGVRGRARDARERSPSSIASRGRQAVADANRPRVRRAAARQHRRRAALRVPRDRRHREHGVARYKV